MGSNFSASLAQHPKSTYEFSKADNLHKKMLVQPPPELPEFNLDLSVTVLSRLLQATLTNSRK